VGGAGKPVPSADAWHWRAVRSARETPGNWPGLERRDQAGSPPSHTWRGPCLIQRGTGDSTRTETPARTRIPVATAICRTPQRIIRRRRRTPQCGLRAGRASGGGTLPDGFPAPAFPRRVYRAGLGIFTAAPAACALAPDLGTLIALAPSRVPALRVPRLRSALRHRRGRATFGIAIVVFNASGALASPLAATSRPCSSRLARPFSPPCGPTDSRRRTG
jgi:hypothetical protein